MYMKEEDLIRIGAIMDCEGSAGIYLVKTGQKKKDGTEYPRYPRPKISIGMIHDNYLRIQIFSKMGFGRLIPTKKTSAGNQFWVYSCYSRDALKFAKLIKDYCSIKKEILEQIIEFYRRKV